MEINKIYCGDALKLIDELDIEPNLIILSPPDINETNFSLNEYKLFIETIYQKCMEKLNINGVLCSSTTDTKRNSLIYTKHIDIINALCKYDLFKYKIWQKTEKANLYILTFTHLLFFRKSKKITNNKLKEFYPDVWNLPIDKVAGYKTKDTFPTELVKRFILNFTNEKDVVLDPFIGTGKTAKICKEHNRGYVGFEIEEKHVLLAQELLA
jgi:hypothetical protein